MSFNGIYKLSPKYDLHKYIDSLPVGSDEYWEAIAKLSSPDLSRPAIVFTEADMAKGSY